LTVQEKQVELSDGSLVREHSGTAGLGDVRVRIEAAGSAIVDKCLYLRNDLI